MNLQRLPAGVAGVPAARGTMWRLCIVVVAVWFVVAAAYARASDRIKLKRGNQSAGTITLIGPTELTIELGATKRKYPINEIESVTFDSEPNALTQARIAVAAGRYDDAVKLLGRIDSGEITRKAISDDVEFYRGLAAARQALAGNGSIAGAGRLLLGFEKANKTSFHYFEACEAIGDLLAAVSRFDGAAAYYNKLGSAPWPEYKMRAGVLAGRALVSQEKYDQAIARFDEVLAATASGKEADPQKLAATLGKAQALAGTGKTDEAAASVEEIIAQANPENQELHARAYNVLGNCHKSAGKNKEALIAFLHVDLLYSRFPEQHAEALANLATLWAEVDKADRAAQARSLLEQKYPNSAWAQK